MSKLAALGIVLILESGRLGERFDRGGWSGQEMPALCRTGSPVALQVFRFLCGCHLRRLFGIETHSENVKLFSHIELQHPQCAFQSAQHFSAQHRTLVVDQIQNHRPLAKVVSQLDRFPGFIAKREAGRDLFVQALLNAYVLQSWRPHVRRRRQDALRHSLAPRRRAESTRRQHRRRDQPRNARSYWTAHCHFPFITSALAAWSEAMCRWCPNAPQLDSPHSPQTAEWFPPSAWSAIRVAPATASLGRLGCELLLTFRRPSHSCLAFALLSAGNR